MRLFLFFCAICAVLSAELIAPPYFKDNFVDDGEYYYNEAWRAMKLENKKLARDLFYKACVKTHEGACLALNGLIWHKKHIKLRNKENIETIYKYCSDNHAQSCFLLGKYFESGELDSFKSNVFFKKACKLNFPEACAKISDTLNLDSECKNPRACFEASKVFLNRNKKMAKFYLNRACALDSKEACTKYIEILSLE